MSPVTAHTHKKLNICYLSYASTLNFVTKTHSFRDKTEHHLQANLGVLESGFLVGSLIFTVNGIG